MINTTRDMKYIARHVSRQQIYRKIISDCETLASVVKELIDDPESREAMKAMFDAASMLCGTLDILDVKNGYSPEMCDVSRTSPFLINDWANALREAEKREKCTDQH